MRNTDTTGYFGPDTITWRLYREPWFVFGGVRALILQVAHPAVADGVAHYSRFQSDPFGRAYRTFEAMASIYFGDRAMADATAFRLHHLHAGIKGRFPEAGVDTDEREYSANDPDLLLWVLSTLTDTTLKLYDLLQLKGLPADWQEQFYEESKITARLFGIPGHIYPRDLTAFRQYFDDVLNGPLLGSTLPCRDMAQAIIRHPRAPSRLATLLAAGLLPQTLCERLDIASQPDAATRLEKWLRRARIFYRMTPSKLRYNPAYWQAKKRIAREKQANAPVLGLFYDWLGRFVKIPLGLPTPPPAP
ncbi:MAG: DUF2236 domain-containing protein [Lewinellaceae bacterium]|nr:DUF2236 domain-containing protein [Lewinellaceae bacterium]MCB9355652.1 DUF2236 domain-containing protein [Lewinellaceae bacterium]